MQWDLAGCQTCRHSQVLLCLATTTPDKPQSMFTRIFIVLLSFFFVELSPSLSQDQPSIPSPPAPIATDRPSFTNSSIVVPPGSFQGENGLLVTTSSGQTVLDGPETLLRAGVASRTELRLTVPNYFYNVTTGGGPGSGFGD